MLRSRALGAAVRACVRGVASARRRAPGADERFAQLLRTRGVLLPGSELYGGLAGTFDFGPLGALMRMELRKAWLDDFVLKRADCFPVETPVVMHPRVWQAAGHVDVFEDTLIECRACKRRWRDDAAPAERGCGGACDGSAWEKPRAFNLLFRSRVGASAADQTEVYLRPETAQGMFVAFHPVQAALRRPLPFGLAQTGRAFRNEISPGNSLFRMREFEQMELEWFCRPADSAQWYRYWVDQCVSWLQQRLRFRAESFRAREYTDGAHYALATTDVEFEFPHGWGELWGVALRGSFDLERHGAFSGRELLVADPQTGEKFLPHVVEPSVGLDRLLLALLYEHYDEEGAGGAAAAPAPASADAEADAGTSSVRTVLRLPPSLAPVKAAVLPLLRKPAFVDQAAQVQRALLPFVRTDLDVTGSVGRRYRRQDEVGTPLCITIDHETLDNGTVTARDRDTMAQVRVPVAELVARARTHDPVGSLVALFDK